LRLSFDVLMFLPLSSFSGQMMAGVATMLIYQIINDASNVFKLISLTLKTLTLY